jgi:hypothetical protein
LAAGCRLASHHNTGLSGTTKASRTNRLNTGAGSCALPLTFEAISPVQEAELGNSMLQDNMLDDEEIIKKAENLRALSSAPSLPTIVGEDDPFALQMVAGIGGGPLLCPSNFPRNH